MISNNCESYKVFCCVAKHGNITSAASELFMAQSTVSRIIQGLEHALDCTLLFRTTKGVHLTGEGRFLYEQLGGAFEQIERAEHAFEKKYGKGKTVLSVGASELTLQHYLLPYIERFKKENPGVVIRTDYTYPDRVIGDLRSDVFDLAVLGTPLEYDEQFEFRNLNPLEYTLAAGAEYASLTRQPVRLKELEAYPFISMNENMSIRRYAERIFTEHDMRVEFEYTVGSMPLFIKLLQGNYGLGLLPRVHVQEALASGTLFEIPICDALPCEHICLLLKREAPRESVGRRFAEMLIRS